MGSVPSAPRLFTGFTFNYHEYMSYSVSH